MQGSYIDAYPNSDKIEEANKIRLKNCNTRLRKESI